MEKTRKWSIIGAIFTLILGTLLHFVYEWFGGAFWSVIGAVNESTWEHLKLIFWPIVIFGIIEYIAYGKKTPGFLWTKVLSILLGMATIVVLFYTYTGILGFHIAFVDIATFVIGTIVAYRFAYVRLTHPQKYDSSEWTSILALVLIIILIVCFVCFTFQPPHIGLFLDPVTNTYGILP